MTSSIESIGFGGIVRSILHRWGGGIARVATVALILASGPGGPTAFGGDCHTPEDPVVYDPSEGDLPEDAADAWETLCPNPSPPSAPVAICGTITDSFLRVVDDSDDESSPASLRAIYYRSDVFEDICQDAVFEVCGRADSDMTTPHDINIVWHSQFRSWTSEADGKVISLAITNDGVGFTTDGPGAIDWLDHVVGGQTVQARVLMDTTSATHLYRVVKDETAAVKLYIDGARQAAVTVLYDDFPDEDEDNRVVMAATGSDGTSSFDLYHFRYRIGGLDFPDSTPPEPCDADFNTDGVVNGIDLGILLANWGECEDCPQDLNGDDVVNGIDLGFLLAAWLTECP